MACINIYLPLKQRWGQIGINKKGERMKIICCLENDRVEIEFLDGKGCIVETGYSSFLEGAVKNYKRVEYGFHGYIDQGPYETITRDNDGKKIFLTEYNTWVSMHRRAENFNGTHPSYEDVTIDKIWWSYQNFAMWYNDNKYEVENDILRLDKDILVPGNRVYSPETCCLVPDKINQLFKQPMKKDDNMPMGVYKEGNRYRTVKLYEIDNNGNVMKHCKSFKTPEDAHECYKFYKEKYIHDIADLYKDIIPTIVYVALKQYEFNKYIINN